MVYRLTSPVLVLLASSAPLLAGQTSVVGSRFPQLQDSLATVSDTTRLRTLFRQNRDDPLRAGAIGLRLGQLGADPDFSDARSSFRRATRQHSHLAETWFGLGRAEAERSEWEMRDRLRLGSRVGIGALERAADNYQRALLADPRYVPAALALADVELSLLDSIRLRDARAAVRRSVAALTSPSGDLLLAWGRLERATGNLQVAAGAFERY